MQQARTGSVVGLLNTVVPLATLFLSALTTYVALTTRALVAETKLELVREMADKYTAKDTAREILRRLNEHIDNNK